MRILIVHNKYKNAGGEDAVCQSETEMLLNQGHVVDQLIFDNAEIKSFFDKVRIGVQCFYNTASARILRYKILEFNPEVIHVHNLWPVASPSILFVAKRFNIPVVATLHNFRLICPSGTLFHQNKVYEKSIRSMFPVLSIFKRVYRNSMIETGLLALSNAFHNLIGTWERRVDIFIALSKFQKDTFAKSALLVSPERFCVKPNSVRDRGCGFSERENFYLFVGRLTEEKGIRVLLRAASLCDFRCVIVGDGPLRSMVEEEARVNPNIQYVGTQKNSVVIDLMKRCRALIFPSLWYEGSPMTVLEALSTGTVVIASNLGTMAEIIQDKINGLLFDAGNENDLLRVIREVNGRSVDLKYISRKGRFSYSENYTPERNYAVLMQIYNLALARKAQQEWAKENFVLKST